MKQIRQRNGKSEDVTKILNLSGHSLLFVGKKGTVVRRNLALERQSKNILDMQSFPQLNHCQCRKMRMSSFAITDATYLEVSRHYCISTSNRTLHFFHEISSDQWETFRLVGMPTIPLCLDNNFHVSNDRSTRDLFIGDHLGNIYVLSFLYPQTMLFARSYTTHTQIIKFDDLHDHGDYVICRKFQNVHNDFVDKILHLFKQNLLLSSSRRDPKNKLLVQDLSKKKPVKRILQHKKGVTCFDADYETGSIVTGSKDFLIRLWKLPFAENSVLTLFGHCAVIADVKLWAARNLLLSVCREFEIKLWNSESGRLVRSILMNFANIGPEPRTGKSVLHIPMSNIGYFLVTCCDTSRPVEVDKILKEDRELLLRKYIVTYHMAFSVFRRCRKSAIQYEK